MQFDPATLDAAIVYKLLTATVTPRPIAWVTTQNADGRVNAAPFSFFNAIGANPPLVALGLMADPARGFKDTARNIMDNGEFVVNLVSSDLGDAMNITAVDAPDGVEELALAGLDTAASDAVRPPRIAASPVSLECVNHTTLVTGPQQSLVVGRIVAIHIADNFVLDAERGHIDNIGLDLIARSFGSGYVRSTDRFDMERPTWAGWLAEHPDDAPDKA